MNPARTGSRRGDPHPNANTNSNPNANANANSNTNSNANADAEPGLISILWGDRIRAKGLALNFALNWGG